MQPSVYVKVHSTFQPARKNSPSDLEPVQMASEDPSVTSVEEPACEESCTNEREESYANVCEESCINACKESCTNACEKSYATACEESCTNAREEPPTNVCEESCTGVSEKDVIMYKCSATLEHWLRRL